MIYLYLKTHNVTGLKYLGKHESEDPESVYSYPGSGIDWLPHLKEHGDDVTTEVLFSSECKNEFRSVSIGYSKHFDIVNSKDFANRTIEEGQGGGINTGRMAITDGAAHRYIDQSEPIPKGWVKGTSTSGRIIITDGTRERRIPKSEPIPEGWVKGCGPARAKTLSARIDQTQTRSYYHIDDPDTIYYGRKDIIKAYGVSTSTISSWQSKGKVIKLQSPYN